MKDKANKGWIKELAKNPKADASKKSFDYKKPISKVDKVQNMAVNSRNRDFRTAKKDNSTNFKLEQTAAKQSHKGTK